MAPATTSSAKTWPQSAKFVPLRQHLINVLVGHRHDIEYSVDIVNWKVLVKEVAHGVHEMTRGWRRFNG
jgi:hypothetical protein